MLFKVLCKLFVYHACISIECPSNIVIQNCRFTFSKVSKQTVSVESDFLLKLFHLPSERVF